MHSAGPAWAIYRYRLGFMDVALMLHADGPASVYRERAAKVSAKTPMAATSANGAIA